MVYKSLSGVNGFDSHEWPRQNFSLQNQYNIKQTSDNNKEKYQLGDYKLIQYQIPGVKLIFFFSDSHLASKFFKVVANSKRVGHHFQRQTKPFFYAVIVLEIKLGKRSLTCYKVDTRMDDLKHPSSPKSKMASSYRLRCMCCVLETNLTGKFVADLSLQIFLIHSISR